MTAGNEFNGTAAARALQERDELGQEHIALVTDIQAFIDSIHTPELTGAIKLLTQILAYLATVFTQFEGLLSRFADQRFKRSEFLRKLLVDHGVASPPKRHSWFNTIFSVQIFMLLEVMVVSISLIADGQMGAPEAVAFASVFALATVLLGMGAGYFGLAKMPHKLNAPIQSIADKRTRNRGAVTFTVLVVSIVWMIFIAARVRATRSHDHVFSMNEVGFFATFNDGMVWLIICVAGASAVISTRKGYLIEPIKGLANAQHYAFDAINAEVQDFADETLDALDARIGDAAGFAHEILEAAEKIKGQRSGKLRRLNRNIREFNHKVDSSIARLTHLFAFEIDRYERTTGEPFTGERRLDLSGIETLRLTLVSDADIPCATKADADAEALRTLLSDVSTAHQQTSLSIETALAAFRAEQPALSPVTPPKGV